MMSLHLLKLCVGADSIRDLEDWIGERLANLRRKKEVPEHIHTTRMMPKRGPELLDGGSLYWVIKGQIAARQALLDIRSFTDAEGIGRCRLVLEPKVVAVWPRPFRAFQGWRYLADQDCPADLASGTGQLAEMPEPLRRELRELGLL
jgi:hypothetical protein